MTLILTLLTYDKVVQASDRRLSKINGDKVEVWNDFTNKAITVSCKDACFALAYTGWAVLGRHRTATAEWLTDYLWSLDATERELKDIALGLKSEWKPVLQSTPGYGREGDQVSSVVLAGYYRFGEPFAIRVSDKEPDHLFRIKPYLKRRRACALLIDGEERAIDKAIGQRVKRLRRKRFFQRSSKECVVEELAYLMRAACLTEYGKVISRNCLGVVITPKPSSPGCFTVWSDYHGEDNRDYFGPYHTHFNRSGRIEPPD